MMEPRQRGSSNKEAMYVSSDTEIVVLKKERSFGGLLDSR